MSLVDATVLQFSDAAHAHAHFSQLVKGLRTPEPSSALHGVQLGDEQSVETPGPYGPFDLAQREVQYMQRQGDFYMVFRRGAYLVELELYGDFAPIDLGRYGSLIDQRLQRATAARGA